jgi:hypothetical protein
MYNNDNNKVGDHVSAAFSPSFGFSNQRIGNYQVGLVEVGLPRYNILGHDFDDHGGYNTTGLYGHSNLPFAQKKDYEGKANLGRHQGTPLDPTYVQPTQKRTGISPKKLWQMKKKGYIIKQPFVDVPMTQKSSPQEKTAYGQGGRWGTGAGGRWGFGRTTETETVQAPRMTVQTPRPRRRPQGRPFAGGLVGWFRRLFGVRPQVQAQAPVRRTLPNLPGAEVEKSLIY